MKNVRITLDFLQEQKKKESISTYNRWRFGCNSDDTKIADKVGYPWNYSIDYILKGYVKNVLSFEDVKRYFELLKETKPEITAAIKEQISIYQGSDKWISYAYEWIEKMKQIITANLYKNSIKTCDITCRDSYSYKLKMLVKFDHALNYQQKRKFNTDLNAACKNIYTNVMTEPFNSLRQVISYDFLENGKKCNPAEGIKFIIPSNNWQAIGLSEEAQFIPKMGSRKK